MTHLLKFVAIQREDLGVSRSDVQLTTTDVLKLYQHFKRLFGLNEMKKNIHTDIATQFFLKFPVTFQTI